jgi:ankyrin repeat protein
MCSPLHIAIECNYPVETLELLIDRYPGLINGRDVEWDHYCPLVSAAYSGKTNVVQLLVRKGANVDYAVEQLQQMDAEQPIALILKCSQDHNQAPQDTVRKLANPQR